MLNKLNLILILVFMTSSAYAADQNLLIPTDSSIPPDFLLFTTAPENGGYALQYNSKDGNGRLMISEIPETADFNYRRMSENYDHMMKDHDPMRVEKMKDVNFNGTEGSIYQNTIYARKNYDLILHDGDKLFRIYTSDAANYQFTAEKVEQILQTFVRLTSPSFVPPNPNVPVAPPVNLPDVVPKDLHGQSSLWGGGNPRFSK